MTGGRCRLEATCPGPNPGSAVSSLSGCRRLTWPLCASASASRPGGACFGREVSPTMVASLPDRCSVTMRPPARPQVTTVCAVGYCAPQ